MSLRDKLIAAPPIFRRQTIDVPEWDCKFDMRALSVADKARLSVLAGGAGSELDVMVLLLTTCAFDPDGGEPVFTDDDEEWIRRQEASVVERLATAALELSGLTPDTKKALDGPKDDSSKTPNTVTSSSGPSV